VREFLDNRMINFCISDVVYREKRRVVMFQDVYCRHDSTSRLHRQLVISSPIFDETGEVTNIIANVRRLDTMNDFYHQASASELEPHFSRIKEPPAADIVAHSDAMRGVLAVARTVADVDSSVLVAGESGTGKEVVAQYIHSSGSRQKGQLVAINCASLPSSLLEAELFGYRRGSFTGAIQDKPGLFEVADGGTLFLDEVDSLPLDLQGKLLRALETKNIQRLGSTRARAIDFRLVSAVNKNLQALVDAGKFRADLFYRLNVILIHIPPLRERQEDILPLAFHFLKQYCERHNKHKVFSENTLSHMRRYAWPGNVRELKNFVERSVVMTIGEIIEIHNIGGIVADSGAAPKGGDTEAPVMQERSEYATLLENNVSLGDFLTACELAYVHYALEHSKSTYHAAELLGTSQSSIMRRKKKFSMQTMAPLQTPGGAG
jgi:transcriptional regulator with PAS, ATPase and Fis domain